MFIRPAQHADVDGLAQTHVAAWHEAYTGLLPLQVLQSVTVEFRRTGWLETLSNPNRHTLVCDIDGDIVGFASFGPSRDSDATADTAELMGLYVHPKSWRQGIGRALWNAVADQVDRQYASTTLWVLRDNIPARSFYESIGFGPRPESEKADPRVGGAIEVRYRRRAGTK